MFIIDNYHTDWYLVLGSGGKALCVLDLRSVKVYFSTSEGGNGSPSRRPCSAVRHHRVILAPRRAGASSYVTLTGFGYQRSM